MVLKIFIESSTYHTHTVHTVHSGNADTGGTFVLVYVRVWHRTVNCVREKITNFSKLFENLITTNSENKQHFHRDGYLIEVANTISSDACDLSIKLTQHTPKMV